MPDMLVKLYDLPDAEPALASLRSNGLIVRRAIPPERNLVVQWVRSHFSEGWASETETALSHLPPTCFIAVDQTSEQHQIVGFACIEATNRNFFGPIGTLEPHRGRGIGRALLLAGLHAMREMGYGYAIIGAVGPVDFYARNCNAVVIENSSPGIYRGMLRYSRTAPR